MTIYTLSHGSLKLDVSDQGGVIEGFWRDTTPLLRPGKKSGVATDASHDLFVLPLCRKHHNELHTDTVAFEDKYGSQLELIFRFIDRALAIGVLA